MSSEKIFVGTDVGSSRTKVAVLNANKKLIGYCVKKSGTDFSATAEKCLATSLGMAQAAAKDIANSVSTGYGRKNVPFANDTKKRSEKPG